MHVPGEDSMCKEIFLPDFSGRNGHRGHVVLDRCLPLGGIGGTDGPSHGSVFSRLCNSLHLYHLPSTEFGSFSCILLSMFDLFPQSIDI